MSEEKTVLSDEELENVSGGVVLASIQKSDVDIISDVYSSLGVVFAGLEYTMRDE